jgi:hypothetical protein
MRADLALGEEPLGEEALQKSRECGDGVHREPPQRLSNRKAACLMSFGCADRYQYVSLMLLWPRYVASVGITRSICEPDRDQRNNVSVAKRWRKSCRRGPCGLIELRKPTLREIATNDI